MNRHFENLDSVAPKVGSDLLVSFYLKLSSFEDFCTI